MASAALHLACVTAVFSHPLNFKQINGRLQQATTSAHLNLQCSKNGLHEDSTRRRLQRTSFMPETNVLALPQLHSHTNWHLGCRQQQTVAELAGEGSLDSSAGASTSTSSSSATSSVGGRATAATVEAAMVTENLLEAAEAALGMDFDSLGMSDRLPGGSGTSESSCGLRDAAFLRKVALAKDAEEALEMICQNAGEGAGGVVTTEDAGTIMKASLAAGNADLAFSLLSAMRSSLSQKRLAKGEEDQVAAAIRRWQWAPPDVSTYATLVRGLAASLRVADAVQTVADVRRRGVPAGDEVPFGKVVDCPSCKKPIAVVQPQHGVQLVPCARCRYQYELMSGDVVSSESEPVGGDMSVFERGLRTLRLARRPAPAAVHSMVVRAPDGLARTHRFATSDVNVPAQPGERVTVVASAPASTQWSLGLGPIRSNARAPGWRPSEPMSVTNHETSRVSDLLRAPPKAGTGAAWDANILLPAAILLAGSDAATAFIDPALPQLIAAGAAAAAATGGLANAYVLPRLNQLPERSVGGMAIRQQLLSQHELLQSRLASLTANAADEVRMLARMCQLQNKMEAIGEPSTYSARIERVRQARDGLDQRLDARLELIDSYAKILSMIEIEVELDADILAAEQAGAADNIADQIEKLMEVEALQKEWKLQAEANDEVERLLRNAPPLPEN